MNSMGLNEDINKSILTKNHCYFYFVHIEP